MEKRDKKQAKYKTKEERVKDCVGLLKQLEDFGITKEFPGRQELDKQIREYIENGLTWSGRIAFPEIHRMAEVILPQRKIHTASVNLRFVPGPNTILKDE